MNTLNKLAAAFFSVLLVIAFVLTLGSAHARQTVVPGNHRNPITTPVVVKHTQQSPCVIPGNLKYDHLKHSDTVQPGDSLGMIMVRNAIPMSELSAVLKANPQISNPNLIYAGHTVQFGTATLPRYAVLAPRETVAFATQYWFGGSSAMPGAIIGGKNDKSTFFAFTNETSNFIVVPMYTGPDSGQWYRFILDVPAEGGSCTPAPGHSADLYKGVEYTQCDFPYDSSTLLTKVNPVWFGDCMGFPMGMAGAA